MQSYLDEETRSRAVAAALGNESFDLILTGGTVVDVGTGELRQSDVGLVGPMVASVHPTGSRIDAADVFDCSGRFIAPGFIDMHVHFESSMLTPGGYAEVVCPRGTTTVFIDPHELANIAGVEGVRYAVDRQPRIAGALRGAGSVMRSAAAGTGTIRPRPPRG